MKELEDTYGGTEAANMADVYAFRGEIDTAFKWLDKAVEIKDPVLLDAMNYPSFKFYTQTLAGHSLSRR